MLGLEPTINSGSGWLQKEDGESEHVLCQLKSTDANSIRVFKHDLDLLEYNASVAHKIPVFAVQFIQSNEVYLLVKPEVLEDAAKYLTTGEAPAGGYEDVCGVEDVAAAKPVRMVKSSAGAREKFYNGREQQYKKVRCAK